jgi:uncharacterized protein
VIVFCDTSALYAVGDRNDEAHELAAQIWELLIVNDRSRLVTTNYVLVESFSLVHKRQGLESARILRDAVEQNMEVAFVDAPLHQIAMQNCLRARRRDVSLVDHVSFAFMRRHDVHAVFAFDKHFSQQGFTPIRAIDHVEEELP